MTTSGIKAAGAASLLFWSIAATANAASLSLVATTPSQNVSDGDTVSFEIYMDFTGDPTIGGGFSILFDPNALGFVSFYRDETLGDPSFSRDPDILDGILDSWAVGSFDGLPETAVLGSVTFEVLTTMGLNTVIGMQGIGICGCWTGVDFDFQFPDYGIATVSRVPVPAAVWLFLSGLAASFGISRGRSNAWQWGQVYTFHIFDDAV